MANSRRIYITLNSDKEKDRIIEELLSFSYSESDFIKETLYRLAMQSDNLQSLNTISTEKVQKITNRNKNVKKNNKPKSNNKVQKGANNNLKDKKDIKSNDEVLKDINSNKEILIDTNNTYTEKGQINADNIDIMQQNDNTELMNNLSSNLDNYF